MITQIFSEPDFLFYIFLNLFFLSSSNTASSCILSKYTSIAETYGFRPQTAPASLLAFPETPPKGEVTASGGLPLYLAEEYERADLTKSEYARASAIFLALDEQGFDPNMQSGLLIEAAGEELPLDDVTAPEGYQPANICAADSGRTQVCRQFGENVFLLITKLKSGKYLDCEGLYREYVYSAYGKLTADEQREMEEKFGIDGTLPLDRKLAAVKSGINAKVTDESERSPLTVKLARSCGLAAREVRGVYFGAMPASGRADLSEGEQRSWVEVYIDGAGWAVFESKPEYAGASPLLPEGASPDGESTFSDSAEQYIYAAAPPRILRIGDVMNLLSVSRPTVRRYVKFGHLALFYGRERRALGVTSESFVRFTERRSRGTNAPGTVDDAPGHKGWTRREKSRMLRSSLELKMRNMMHFDGRTTQRQKCERIDELLRQFPEASFNMGCHAAGVPRSTYANHRLRNKRDKTRYAAMRRTVIDAVSALHPDRSEEVNISALLKQLQRKRIRIARQTLRDALHKAGYILRPRGRA